MQVHESIARTNAPDNHSMLRVASRRAMKLKWNAVRGEPITDPSLGIYQIATGWIL
jgi:hypothetical protein